MEFLTFLVFLGLLYTMLVSSYQLLMGISRQFSIAHAAMWGLGAYSAAYVTLRLGWPLWAGFPTAVIVGAIGGALMALPALRVGIGVYLAIVTFAFQVIFVNLLRNLDGLTGGSGGMPGIPSYGAVGFLSRTQAIMLLTALLAGVVVALVGLWSRGSYGRTLRALGIDHTVLEGLGRDTRWLKIQVFALSGGLGAIAGVLYGQYLSFVSPESFTVHQSILLMTMLLVGGSHTVFGPVVGAWFFVIVPEVLTRVGLPDSLAAPLQQMLFGLLLILFMIFRSEGIIAPRHRRVAADLLSGAAVTERTPSVDVTDGAP